MTKPTAIAITIGDVNGIGPEVALKAVHRKRWPASIRFILVGSASVVEAQAHALGLPSPAAWNPDVGQPPPAKVVVWDPAPARRLSCRPGRVLASAGAAAGEWIRAAIQACLERQVDAMVTAPINKKAFHKAGIRFPGHTEMLAHYTGARKIAMMLMGGALRVVTVTRHVPLAEVSRRLARSEIVDAIRLTNEALPWLGCRRRRIGVCGLNPHAGEGGDIGREELTTIAPAIRAAKRAGANVAGPVPSDVIFYQAVNGAYDAVVSMYHDQGLGPLKMLAFEKGINLTLGLPIVRTSPDHGTAFDIAGEGKANPSSMIEAVRLACVLARKRNPWGRR